MRSGSLTAGSGEPASSFWLRHSLPNQPVHWKAEFRFCYILEVAEPPPVMCIVMRLRDPTMKIHGLRIYRNDLLGIFRPVAAAWRGHIFANDFGVNVNADGTLEDPLPALGSQYGPALVAADVTRQLVLLRGDDFCRWGASLSYNEVRKLLPIFRDAPPFELLSRLYWGSDFRLTPDTWPNNMRALLQMWDGAVLADLHDRAVGDIDVLIRAHAGDQKFKMFFVDLEREYPDPSNQELEIAVPSGATGDA